MRLVCYLTLFSLLVHLSVCSKNCELNTEANSEGKCIKNCIRKCCPFDQHLKGEFCDGPNENKFYLITFDEDELECVRDEEKDFVYGIPDCKAFPYLGDDFYPQKNGTVWLPAHGRIAKDSEYCVDFIEEDDMSLVMGIVCQTYGEYLLDKITDIAVAIALVFLVATTVAYICLPEQTLHIKAHICYLASLTLSTSLEVSIQFSPPGKEVCIFVGYAEYFLSLSYTYWLNVIAINMWRTFGGKFLDSRLQSDQTKQFIIYSVCVWGLALLQTIVVLTVDVFIKDRFSDFNPGILEGKCIFTSGISMIIFYQVPQGISVAANIIIFIRTSLKIREGRNSSFKSNDSRRHKTKAEEKTVTIYIRLLLTMGVNWIIDLILWLVFLLWHSPENYEEYIWYFIKLHNAAYGVALFFIFICTKRVLNQLRARFCKKGNIPRRQPTSSTTEESLRN